MLTLAMKTSQGNKRALQEPGGLLHCDRHKPGPCVNISYDKAVPTKDSVLGNPGNRGNIGQHLEHVCFSIVSPYIPIESGQVPSTSLCIRS